MRRQINIAAKARGEWAGVPMPLNGERLVIAPQYTFAKALGDINKTSNEPLDFKVRASFWSSLRSCLVVICEESDGRITHGIIPGIHGLDKQLRTLGCSDAWGMEQETTALETLRGLISERQFRQYMLTGSFIETSKRSKIIYMFRKLRPTVAIQADHKTDKTHVMCCLCMHPIAHYEDSWAGAMCPSDDVIAHVMMMRGDEALYWRRSTQHQAYRPEAGL